MATNYPVVVVARERKVEAATPKLDQAQLGYLRGLIDGTGIAVMLIGLPLVLTGRWPLLGAISAALVVLVVLTWLWWLKVRLWGFGLWPRRGGRDA